MAKKMTPERWPRGLFFAAARVLSAVDAHEVGHLDDQKRAQEDDAEDEALDPEVFSGDEAASVPVAFSDVPVANSDVQ
jgi:hypothetical protein